MAGKPNFGKSGTSDSGSNDNPISITSVTDNIKQMESEYKELSGLASSTKGMIMPDASNISEEDILNKEMDNANKLADSETMVLAGLYSLSKTGDSTAFMKAMANRGMVEDNITSLKFNMRTVSNPMSSYSSRMASSAALQRDFGIDAAKDYKHINTAMVQLKALQGQFAEKILNKTQGLYQSIIKAQPKAEQKQQYDNTNYLKSIDLVFQLEGAIEEKPDSDTAKSMGPIVAQLKDRIDDFKRSFIKYGKYEEK